MRTSQPKPATSPLVTGASSTPHTRTRFSRLTKSSPLRPGWPSRRCPFRKGLSLEEPCLNFSLIHQMAGVRLQDQPNGLPRCQLQSPNRPGRNVDNKQRTGIDSRDHHGSTLLERNNLPLDNIPPAHSLRPFPPHQYISLPNHTLH